MSKFEVGTRVKGLLSHNGKYGTIRAIYDLPNFSTLLWDGGKRQSTVQNCYLEMVK